MALPNDLLEQAFHLANREPKRPRQASLRRAVSTAYYALFHRLSGEMARNWKHAADRAILARLFDHGPMAQGCANKRDELNKYFNTRPAPGHTHDVRKHLHTVTSTFVGMREHREKADYDEATKWTRTDVLEKIQSVEAAFQSWRAIRDDPETHTFLATLLLKGRRS